MEEEALSWANEWASQSRIREGKQNRVTITAEKSTREIVYSNNLHLFQPGLWYFAILLILVRSWNNMLFVPIVVVNSLMGLFRIAVPSVLRIRCVSFKWRKLSDSWEGEQLDLPVHRVVEGVILQKRDQIYADAKILDGSIMVDESQWQEKQMEITKAEHQTLMSGDFVSGGAVAVLEQVSDRLILIS